MAADGYVYLLHMERPLTAGHPCRHYTGWAADLFLRIQRHWHGNRASSRLMQVAHERGISFQVARVWEGDRTLERAIKNRKEAPALCPMCSGKAKAVRSYVDRDGEIRTVRELTSAEVDDLLSVPF